MGYFSDIFSTLRQAKASTALVILQIGFSFAVLVNTIAMVSQYQTLVLKDTGIKNEQTLLAITVRPYDLPSEADTPRGDYRNIIERDLGLIRTTPGVVDVALAHGGVPMQANFFFVADVQGNIRVPSQEIADGFLYARYIADENTLALLGVDIIEGRGFEPSDVAWHARPALEGGPSIVITQVLAQKLFPDESAVGKQVEDGDGHVLTVIGVMRTMRSVFNAPWEEHSAFIPGRAYYNENYLVRTENQNTAPIAAALAARLTKVDRDRAVKVEDTDDMKKIILGFYFIINAIVGVVAMLLLGVTALGSYGHMSYTVLKRTKQIGIRRALGATRSYILRYFLAENALLTALGLVPGLLLMIPGNYMIVSAFGYGRFDAAIVLGTVTFMFLIGFLASGVPIARAVAVSPATATRTI